MLYKLYINSLYFYICLSLFLFNCITSRANPSFRLTTDVDELLDINAGALLGSPTDFIVQKTSSRWVSNKFIPLDTPKIKGNKLVGMGVNGKARQGISVSLSADGKTAIVGGPDDDGGKGAAWIYQNVNGVWQQEGNKLVGSGAIGNASQGSSVSLSADGKTAIVGGPDDDGDKGAAWIYQNVNGVWRQASNKLVGKAAKGKAKQGTSVSLSADGKTAIVGGPHDQASKGAVWIYQNINETWLQDRNKLFGSGAEGQALFGHSASLSSDGKSVIVGGFGNKYGVGAVWIYRKVNGVWIQDGNKLVGSGARGDARQGHSVSISADGKTAIVGGPQDYGNQPEDDGTYGLFRNKGAAWIYRKKYDGLFTNEVSWRQEGSKLVGLGAEGKEWQGNSVDLSEDGNTAVVGGHGTDGGKGAFWVYRYLNGVWNHEGNKLIGSGAVGNAGLGWSVSLSADGKTAIIGGPGDDDGKGAVWIFSNENGGWHQY